MVAFHRQLTLRTGNRNPRRLCSSQLWLRSYKSAWVDVGGTDLLRRQQWRRLSTVDTDRRARTHAAGVMESLPLRCVGARRDTFRIKMY
jgi:hypothetical protein